MAKISKKQELQNAKEQAALLKSQQENIQLVKQQQKRILQEEEMMERPAPGWSDAEPADLEDQYILKQFGLQTTELKHKDKFNQMVDEREGYVHISLEDEINEFIASKFDVPEDIISGATVNLKERRLEQLKYDMEMIKADIHGYGGINNSPKWLRDKANKIIQLLESE